MYQRIVVPLDGSKLAAAALTQARDAAKTYNAPLFLVRVVDPPIIQRVSVVGDRTAMGMTGTAYEEGDKEAREYIDREVQRLQNDGIDASGIVMWGHAAASVASAINDTDLLIMSSLGRTGVRRWFMGSVAEDILKRTSVPVLIVRQPSAAD